VSAHEDLKREHEIKSSSDRSFGLVMAGAFAILGGLRWYRRHEEAGFDLKAPANAWFFAVAAVFLLVALAAPGVLAPLNKLWTKLGLLMGKVMAPIVMGLLLYLVVTPVGLLVRLFGGDPLRLKFDPKADSYWLKRDPPGPAPDTMSNQF